MLAKVEPPQHCKVLHICGKPKACERWFDLRSHMFLGRYIYIVEHTSVFQAIRQLSKQWIVMHVSISLKGGAKILTQGGGANLRIWKYPMYN
jgi:hypothetical protein